MKIKMFVKNGLLNPRFLIVGLPVLLLLQMIKVVISFLELTLDLIKSIDRKVNHNKYVKSICKWVFND